MGRYRSPALLLDEGADLLGRGKDDRGAITHHARADHDRLARLGPELAAIGLEAQVELPDRCGLTLAVGDIVGVAAVENGRHLVLGPGGFQVGYLGSTH